MRDIAKVFQGMLQAVPETINNCSLVGKETMKPSEFLVCLWKHELDRVFADKMTENRDVDKLRVMINSVTTE